MKINFDDLQVYLDIEKKKPVSQNLRKQFANLIYTQGNGITAHALAFKIYNGDSTTDYNEEETTLIRQYSTLCAPCIIDAITTALDTLSQS